MTIIGIMIHIVDDVSNRVALRELQGLVMVCPLLFVAFKGTVDVGGVGGVYNRNMKTSRIVAP